jgi:hypothetical protein
MTWYDHLGASKITSLSSVLQYADMMRFTRQQYGSALQAPSQQQCEEELRCARNEERVSPKVSASAPQAIVFL